LPAGWNNFSDSADGALVSLAVGDEAPQRRAAAMSITAPFFLDGRAVDDLGTGDIELPGARDMRLEAARDRADDAGREAEQNRTSRLRGAVVGDQGQPGGRQLGSCFRSAGRRLAHGGLDGFQFRSF
jgi:hypothetical protein